MYKEVWMYIRGLGLTPQGWPIGLKAVSPGIMLLLIPMVFSVYASEVKTNDRSLSVLEYLQKVYVLCTGKSWYVHENNWLCTKKICMYIKNVFVGTYTVREAHD